LTSSWNTAGHTERSGDALKGKMLRSVVTTGGSRKAYCSEGHNQYTLAEFLRPVEHTARLCRMEYETSNDLP